MKINRVAESKVSHDLVKELFDYDPENGILSYKNGKEAGGPAKEVNK